MIDPKDIDRLVTIVRTGYAKNAGAGVSGALASSGLPVRKGWSGPIPGHVRQRLRRELIVDHGVPAGRFTGTSDSKIEARSRRAAQENARYEKKAVAVQKDRVFIKPVPGCNLIMNGSSIPVMDGCHMCIPIGLASTITAPAIILVENLEVFQDFHLMGFAVPDELRDALIVFRGKPHVVRQDTAEAFLKEKSVPVTACFDIDPSGLSNALSTPYFRDILWPGREALMKLKRLWRPDLYRDQSHVMARLDVATGELAKARDFLRESGAGVMQEAYLDFKRPSASPQKSKNIT
jgi:hypothetical protein